MTRKLFLFTVLCSSVAACSAPQRTATVPAGTDWSTVACVQKGVAPLRCATMRQWHDEMQAHGKPKSIIAGALVALANSPPGPTGAPTALLPPNRPAAPTYSVPMPSSAPTYDAGYAPGFVLADDPKPVDDDDGPPPPRSFMTMPMGNGATIIAGDINGIVLPMGNGSTLYSFD